MLESGCSSSLFNTVRDAVIRKSEKLLLEAGGGIPGDRESV